MIITGNTNEQEFQDYMDKNKGIKANFVYSKPFTFLIC